MNVIKKIKRDYTGQGTCLGKWRGFPDREETPTHISSPGGGDTPLPMCSDARTMHPEMTPKRVAAILTGYFYNRPINNPKTYLKRI